MNGASFGAAAVKGDYAVAVTAHGGSAPVCAFGLIQFDGEGTVTGTFTESQPGTSYGTREVVTTPFRGSYKIESDGFGTVRLSDSQEPDVQLALRNVTESNGQLVAQELALVFRAIHERTGGVRTAVGFRRYEGAVFDVRSLRGLYNGQAVGTGGETTIAGLGMLSYDGAGGFRESNISNVRADGFRARRFVPGSDAGAYTVAADGTGTLAGGGLLFLVTRIRNEVEIALAEEYVFFVHELVPTIGSLITGVTCRVCD